MQPRRQPKLLPWKMLPGLVEMKGVFAGPDLQYLHLQNLCILLALNVTG